MFVTVEYTDGSNVITETYRTNKEPPENWIPATVHHRIADLEGVDSAVIAVGPVTPEDPADIDKITWRQRFRQLQTLDILLRYNIVEANHPKIQVLKTYLQNNWESMLGV